MRKLVKMFKGLPPQVRSLIMMAGIGSPVGVIYLLQRTLFKGKPIFYVIIAVLIVVVVLALLALIISKIFGRGKGKRSKKMAADLADGSQGGPVSIDVGAAIKANNDKFFGAIKDMKKNVGLNIYELPWYIVMGAPGCGKTRLINEGGLTFSTGKPEGYQLGTLNYNWWFSEDAIFIDMAGRLCDPQDDSDRREWQAFLNTIEKGRKGYPINGAILCVSADHLLEDSPEKHEEAANTSLERLRDLQTKLGVTFATYLIVTKCDKILGFMQYFDRAERDITIKNQMFGWSRPGEFNEAYDPEGFHDDFGGLYARLNELRLRRLNDDSDEIDLGLSFGFPEEFREMLEPLKIYVRTLFPLIKKKSRAIKNLIFRGVYFTSATQEGSLILKHLTERLGEEAASQFPPLDLYPNKRPHFIKDVLLKKAIPEHGLVFRNENEVVRNRKLAKLLKIGGVGLAVILFSVFGLSLYSFSKVIGTPRDRAGDIVLQAEVRVPAEIALKRATEVDEDIDNLTEHRLAATMLAFPASWRGPIDHLWRIHGWLIENVVIAETLREVEIALRSGKPLGADDEVYRDALRAYLGWLACANKESGFSAVVRADTFEMMYRLVQKNDSSIANKAGYVDQVSNYFAHLRDGRNPAALLLREDTGELARAFAPKATVKEAIGHAYKYYAGLASLEEGNTTAAFNQWVRIWKGCGDVESRYTRMIENDGDAARAITSLDGLATYKEGIGKSVGDFSTALDQCVWNDGNKIPDLAEVLLAQRQAWIDFHGKLNEAYTENCSGADDDVLAWINSFVDGHESLNRVTLDALFFKNLKARHILGPNAVLSKESFDVERFKNLVRKVYDNYSDIIVFTEGDTGESDTLMLTSTAQEVRRGLTKLIEDLDELETDVPDGVSGQSIANWVRQLEDLIEPEDEGSPAMSLTEALKGSTYWSPGALQQFDGDVRTIIRRGGGTRLLRTIAKTLGATGNWGISELVVPSERLAVGPSPFFIRPPQETAGAGTRPAGQSLGAEVPKATKRKSRRGKLNLAPRTSATKAKSRTPSRRRSSGQIATIPKCVTHEFLEEQAQLWADLLYWLAEDSDYFLRDPSDQTALNLQCQQLVEDKIKDHLAEHVAAWSNAYEDFEFKAMDDLLEEIQSWDDLTGKLGTSKRKRSPKPINAVAGHFDTALLDLLGNLVWANYLQSVGQDWWANLPDRDADGDLWAWGDLHNWMVDALETNWAEENGGFALNPSMGEDPSDDFYFNPWGHISGRFVDAWDVLADELNGARVLTLPTTKRSRKPKALPEIHWGELQRLRNEYALDDEEKITGALVEFEHLAKTLLSHEISQQLVSIQERLLKYAPDQSADGWPYLNSTPDTEDGMKTVDFKAFLAFLDEVQRAQDYYRGLEESLDGPLRDERFEFYQACERWREFFKPNNAKEPEKLLITVKGLGTIHATEDFGLRKMEDANQFYTFLTLRCSGITWGVDPPSEAEPDVLKVNTHSLSGAQHPQNLVWTWSEGAANTEVTVALEGGRQATINDRAQTWPNVSTTIGRSSPLAICAYLQNYAKPTSRKQWHTQHGFNMKVKLTSMSRQSLLDIKGLPEGLKTGQLPMGEHVEFMLDREMPEPITPLYGRDAPVAMER